MCTAAADKHTIILYEGLSELVLFRFESSENCVILAGNATGLIKVDRGKNGHATIGFPCISQQSTLPRRRQDKETRQSAEFVKVTPVKENFSNFSHLLRTTTLPSSPISDWLDVSSAHIGVVQHIVLRQNDT